ncbi:MULTISPECIES: zeta toxin family protein [Gammaproteobacteria]|uniref:Zeta toxin n=16 Tax=Bacteria TaxID=2 RepID=H6WB21_ACILW|nr:MULTISPECIES: zeta toxin family protein [Gammaproteobacteria]MDQ5669995.1 zeta toxin family protein [Klebsiella pneumoniae]BED93285.1 zeta toxin family protein [Acinetobacter soli]HCE8950700.1 zeta toxin family protein [Morganella morganii]HRN43196.1 zeta toxin family protein [Flavobacterium sp.]AFB35405.1 putative zeta toxin family protein [Acinetobacter lwoffii]
MDNQYKLSDEEHSLVFEKIKADFLNNSLSIVSPKVVITGGQPASGKGKLARDSIDQFKDKGGSVIIDPDQLRAYHPKYNELQKLDDKTSSGFTHHDAKKWSLELIEEAISHKKNIVLDQTSADFQTLKNTVQNFRDKGYKDVELKIMAVPEITSRQGIYHRYEMEKALYETGRFVNIDIHSEIYHKLENTIEQLKDEPIVDKLTVYDRHYNAIEQKDFKAERERPFSDQERQQHEYKWFKVIEAMQTRFAPYTEVEIVKGLQESDRLKLNNQKLVSEVTQVDESTGEKMDVKIVSNLTSNLLVAKDDFEKQDGYLSKNIKVDGEDNLVMFRQNRDHLELINVTKNEMMLDKPIGNHDSKQPESTALQVYMEVKEKLNNLENKILMKVDEQLSNKPKAPEVKGDSKAEVSQFQSKAPELDKHQIIKEVRIQLKQEGKLGADFAKSANGLSVAHGDYIKLNEAYSQKDGLFKTTNLPKDAEIKITGHTTKKGETYATGVHNNSNVELKIRSVEARYGDQYVKRYETNPEVKQAVDQRVIAQQTTFKSLSASRVQELSQSSPKQDKPTSGMKF